MRFTFVTLFRELVEFYFQDSIMKRAMAAEKIAIDFANPRDLTTNKHNKVDDYACGGGAGLVMLPQPLADTLEKIKREEPEAHILFMTPAAKPFRQSDAVRLAGKKRLVLVCGRYEGFDERVIETYADEVFSIGDFILTGGELAAMVVADAVSRNVEGVLGNEASLDDESFNHGLLEAPAFTKPAEFRGMGVPSVLLKGNHSKIASFKSETALAKTKYHRPDLYTKQNKRNDS